MLWTFTLGKYIYIINDEKKKGVVPNIDFPVQRYQL